MTQHESLLLERRHHRQIQLDDDEPVVPAGKFYDKQIKDTKRGTIISERYRDADCMVISTSEDLRFNGPHGEETHTSTSTVRIPIHISFEWIKKQANIEPDTDAGMPWEDEDGWEHSIVDTDEFRGSYKDLRTAVGYISHTQGRVVLNGNSYCGENGTVRLAYFRAKGASKQVARELVATQDRHYIKQIVEWYVDGYPCCYIKIDLKLGGKTYEAACGGVEEAYAEDTENGMVNEIAGEIAAQLEHDGFIVTGHDRQAGYQANRKAALKDRLTHNLNLFNWRD